jgi:hypothetical protein
MAWILLRCRPSWRHRSGYGLAGPATLYWPRGSVVPGALSLAGGRASPSAVWRFAIGQDLPAGGGEDLIPGGPDSLVKVLQGFRDVLPARLSADSRAAWRLRPARKRLPTIMSSASWLICGRPAPAAASATCNPAAMAAPGRGRPRPGGRVHSGSRRGGRPRREALSAVTFCSWHPVVVMVRLGPSHPCKRCNQGHRRHDFVVSVQVVRP